MKFSRAILTGLLALPLAAAGTTVLFQHPESDRLEYEATLKADSSLHSPVDTIQQLRPSVENRRRLQSGLAEAQKAFLGETRDHAIQRFVEVSALLTADDWKRVEREALLFSFLRLAQLARDPTERDKWLLESLRLGRDMHADPTLFPPPLLDRWEELRAETARQALPRKWLDDWPLILVNGRPCSRTSCEPLYAVPGKNRITFLSDCWLPVTAELEVDRLAKFQPKRVPWVSGSCAQPILHAEAASLGAGRPFLSLACASKDREIRLTPPVQATTSFPVLPPSEGPPRKLYHSPWFWTGIGVIAAAIVIHNSQRDKDPEAEPTTTYGF
ncbi:MAG: hypothetical protein AB7G93_21015 [Bdellovibrionales bacterium]